MLSRAFVKPKRTPQPGESSLKSSSSIIEYEDLIFGFMEDVPLISFDEYDDESYTRNTKSYVTKSESTQLTLRQVLRASVGVMGESCLGMTEKVVLLGGKICAVKRFRRVGIGKREFGRRIGKVAQIGNMCEYLVGIMAYLYAKRIKFVVCDYYPMGSLADLLSGARELGHTALEWKHRFKIIQCIAKAIAFIHSQNPSRDKHLKLNVHGNIKSSNIMINVDFSACLSDYGFVQLAMDDDTGQAESPSLLPDRGYTKSVSREGDIYNFGVVLMDILGWPDVTLAVRRSDLFEFCVEREEKDDVFKVLEIALSCRNSLPDERPTIGHILSCLGE